MALFGLRILCGFSILFRGLVRRIEAMGRHFLALPVGTGTRAAITLVIARAFDQWYNC